MSRNTAALLVVMALVVACAGQDSKEPSEADKAVQAVRDLIEVRGLQELDKIQTFGRDSWQAIGNRFLIYETRRDIYLVEFDRRCWELNDDTRIIADERWDANTVRARFDTIRGCRIGRIYALAEEDIAELKNIGEAPGSRN